MKTSVAPFTNPFRPGAGHMPPYLAGRQQEELVFRQLLRQDTILQNMILTGLRGVGKTVLLETLKPQAIKAGWLWVGTDLSESVSVSEESMATRILADLAVLTSGITMTVPDQGVAGFMETNTHVTLNYSKLKEVYERTPGLSSDKLKSVLEYVWFFTSQLDKRGIIFAYDEAQNLSDSATKDQFPLSLLLD
ncbi:MAG: ATP-binding protein, partial [Nitrospiraceae bacterium]|nr:ATP-binding protein [Nitrospiraceae bacterium]